MRGRPNNSYTGDDLARVSTMTREQAREFVKKYGTHNGEPGETVYLTAERFNLLYMTGYVDEFVERWNHEHKHDVERVSAVGSKNNQ